MYICTVLFNVNIVLSHQSIDLMQYIILPILYPNWLNNLTNVGFKASRLLYDLILWMCSHDDAIAPEPVQFLPAITRLQSLFFYFLLCNLRDEVNVSHDTECPYRDCVPKEGKPRVISAQFCILSVTCIIYLSLITVDNNMFSTSHCQWWFSSSVSPAVHYSMGHLQSHLWKYIVSMKNMSMKTYSEYAQS